MCHSNHPVASTEFTMPTEPSILNTMGMSVAWNNDEFSCFRCVLDPTAPTPKEGIKAVLERLYIQTSRVFFVSDLISALSA